MDECLAYFRLAVTDPLRAPAWSAWWARHAELAARSFSLVDYVRLKHRKLLGARQILQLRGELAKEYAPPSPLLTGSCGHCGERVFPAPGDLTGDTVTCPLCGPLASDGIG